VILSAAMPSRLLRAFPAGVPVSRVPLEEAIARASARLAQGEASVADRRREAVANPD
jgi:ATP-dependent DNA helicase DinG